MEINFCPKKCHKNLQVFFFLVNNLIVYMEMEINFCTSLILDFILFFWKYIVYSNNFHIVYYHIVGALPHAPPSNLVLKLAKVHFWSLHFVPIFVLVSKLIFLLM